MKLSDYQKRVEEAEPTCRWCGEDMTTAKIQHYDHPLGGIAVEGFDVPQWLSIECFKCCYRWSLRKLGLV